MRSIRKFITQLINVKDNEHSTQEKKNTTLGCARSKEDHSSPNVSHHRSRSRWAHHATNRSSHALRSNTYSASGIQRGAEFNTISMRPSGSFIPPDDVSGARRAPNMGSVQASRSPRPPFEESVRNNSRRTPGSEDATSVETEIGYPVVGPATIRVGHQTLTSTLYHQNAITFSQDVSTNTPPIENYSVENNPELHVFSDRPPNQSGMTIHEEVDTDQASNDSQMNHRALVPVLITEIPALSGAQSVTVNEEHGISQTVSEQTSQENQLTLRPPTIGTDTSPFRPIPKTTETSSRPNQVRSSESSRLPTNFYFPSQMRRNRSSPAHGNGHRKVASMTEQTEDAEYNKPSRANMALLDCVHKDSAPTELICSHVAKVQPDESPIEMMIHSLHCRGNCKIEAHLKDSSHTSNIASRVQTLECLDMKCQSKDTTIFSSSEADSEQVSLNVMSCVSRSDLPSKLTVTDCVGKSVKNFRVLTIPYNVPLDPPVGEPPDQESLKQPNLDNKESCDENLGRMQRRNPSQMSNAAPEHSEYLDLPQLKSTEAAQAFPPMCSGSENNKRDADYTTQSIFGDFSPLNNDKLIDNAKSLSPSLLQYRTNRDSTSHPVLWPAKVSSKKHHSECISDDNSQESVCDRWLSPPANLSSRNVTDLNAPAKLINHACGPDYPHKTTSIGVGFSVRDLHDCDDVALSKHDYSYATQKDAEIALNHAHFPAKMYYQAQDINNKRMVLPEGTLLEKPLLVVTVPEKDSKISISDQDNSEPIDMENHLFVGKASQVSVASSVYIGDDGKAVVTESKESRLIVLTVSESCQSLGEPCAPLAGAIPKRELGAKPKIRGETIAIRKKMVDIDDSPVRDKTPGVDETPNLGAHSHRITSERNRGRTRNQVSSRKNHLGIKDNHPSPGRRLRKTGSRRSFESSRRRCSEQPIDEVKSIWINPDNERSFPSSSSTIDITVDLNQAFILSNSPKSPSSTQRTAHPLTTLAKPTGDSTSKSPIRLSVNTGVSADLGCHCIVGREHFKGAIAQFNAEYRLCEKCLGQRDNCPKCHSNILSEPNKYIDNLVPTCPASLKKNQTGCRDSNSTDDNDKREPRCLYRPQPCPLANCNKIHCAWKGTRSGIRSHMKKCHGHSGTVHSFRNFFSVQAFDSNLWENRTYGVEVLFVEAEIFELHKVYDPRKSCMWGLLRNILAKDVSLRYTYNIKFQPQNIRGSATLSCEVIGGAEELDKAFEKGKRFKFYLDSFSQEPLQFFGIQLKVIPKASTMLNDL